MSQGLFIFLYKLYLKIFLQIFKIYISIYVYYITCKTKIQIISMHSL